MIKMHDDHRTKYALYCIIMALALGSFACSFPMVVPSLYAPTPTPTPFSPLIIPTLTPEIVPTSTTTPIPPTPQPVAPGYQPSFEPAACDFPVPEGYDPSCGYLVVPENRLHPEGRSVRLHVAVFHSRSTSPAPDPVVHLAGGPGSSSTASAGYLFQQGLGAILDQRDFILIDQRGTGSSQPRLDCPERSALTATLLGGALSPEEADRVIVDSFSQCRQRLLAEGHDLAAYNSAASAADVDDLRRALGYETLNLYGVSYGTRLALTVMRDYPQSVRSAVLDSTYPPQVNLYTALAPNAQRAFEALFARCAADPACSAAYPDLREAFYALVDQLNTSPVTVSLWVNGAETTVQLDGDLLMDVVFVGMYNPSITAWMPYMIYAVPQGDFALLRERLLLYFDTSGALGMQMAVQCSEEIPFNAPEEAYALAQDLQPQIAGFFPASVQSLFAACAEWRPEQLDERDNQPVSGDTPTLILAGELDPITPPEWGFVAASTLSRTTVYEFPANGHWVTRSSGCALQMALAFWEDPSAAPDASCVPSGAMEFH